MKVYENKSIGFISPFFKNYCRIFDTKVDFGNDDSTTVEI